MQKKFNLNQPNDLHEWHSFTVWLRNSAEFFSWNSVLKHTNYLSLFDLASTIYFIKGRTKTITYKMLLVKKCPIWSENAIARSPYNYNITSKQRLYSCIEIYMSEIDRKIDTDERLINVFLYLYFEFQRDPLLLVSSKKKASWRTNKKNR